MKNRFSKSSGFTHILLIFLVLLGIGVYLFAQRFLGVDISRCCDLTRNTNQSIIPDSWQLYNDSEVGYSIEIPPNMIMGGGCRSFILPADEEERKFITDIRKSGIEIGYTIKGLEVGFCNISSPPKEVLDILTLKSEGGSQHIKTEFKGKISAYGKYDNFTEYYLSRNDGRVFRVWMNAGSKEYEEIGNQIIQSLYLNEQ